MSVIKPHSDPVFDFLEIEQVFEKLKDIMSPIKVYLTTHHENTQTINHYKTNGVKIAMTLCDHEDQLQKGQIMISYLEALSGKGTAGLPDLVIKFNNKKISIVQHFISVLSDYISDSDKNPKDNLHLLLESIIGKGKWTEIREKDGRTHQKIKYDKQSWLFQKVREEIKSMPVVDKERLGKKMGIGHLREVEDPDYIGFFEGNLINEEYLKQRDIMKNIFEYAFLDAMQHLKDIEKSGQDIGEISPQEMRSIVLASFQNGVLTQASTMYEEIKNLHQSYEIITSSCFHEKKFVNIIHIPLSAYSKLPQTISQGWEFILKNDLFGTEFIKFAIQEKLKTTGNTILQAGYVRVNQQKQLLCVAYYNNEYFWKIGKDIYLSREQGEQILTRLESHSEKGEKIRMLVYQGIFDFIPVAFGDVYHIGSERGIRNDTIEIVEARLQHKDFDKETIDNVKANIVNMRLVSDKPLPEKGKSWTKDTVAQLHQTLQISKEGSLGPVSIDACPDLLEMVVYGYPSELLEAILSNPTDYHVPTTKEKIAWFEKKHKLS